ncbi:hypothetical protein NEIG_02602 [Nematocida sp. ERTm5]|nr:hypothetical protein NEIG_02602 [Nematocida sp. ERTm5]
MRQDSGNKQRCLKNILLIALIVLLWGTAGISIYYYLTEKTLYQRISIIAEDPNVTCKNYRASNLFILQKNNNKLNNTTTKSNPKTTEEQGTVCKEGPKDEAVLKETKSMKNALILEKSFKKKSQETNKHAVCTVEKDNKLKQQIWEIKEKENARKASIYKEGEKINTIEEEKVDMFKDRPKEHTNSLENRDESVIEEEHNTPGIIKNTKENQYVLNIKEGDREAEINWNSAKFYDPINKMEFQKNLHNLGLEGGIHDTKYLCANTEEGESNTFKEDKNGVPENIFMQKSVAEKEVTEKKQKDLF